jgi:predicted glycoside hydrolase/deacetylase ChbG (UPF0249 family)
MRRALSPSVRVIINADDLGLNPVVNDAIIEWAEAGIVTSTSAMGAAPSTDADAARRLSELGVSIGVHCNLSQFSPLTDPEPLRPLLTPDGAFAGCVRSVQADGALREAVVQELTAQIAAVAALGVDPDHLDSHHHDHFTLWMMRVYRRLRLITGIERVRSPLSNREIGGRRHQLVRARARDVQRYVFGFRTPDQLCDLAYLGRHGIEELRSMSGTVEVMCHPGAGLHGERAAGEALRDAPWVELVDYRHV